MVDEPLEDMEELDSSELEDDEDVLDDAELEELLLAVALVAEAVEDAVGVKSTPVYTI